MKKRAVVHGECSMCLRFGALLPVLLITYYGGPDRVSMCYACRTGAGARWDRGDHVQPWDHWKHTAPQGEA